jgi:hypothetical protein
MEKVRGIRVEEGNTFQLPKGAKIVKKNCSITVEKIKNGYLLNKNYDIEYMVGDEKNYTYYNEKFFSEDNPVSIADIPKSNRLVVDDMD